jgi:hypothetical protein
MIYLGQSQDARSQTTHNRRKHLSHGMILAKSDWMHNDGKSPPINLLGIYSAVSTSTSDLGSPSSCQP